MDTNYIFNISYVHRIFFGQIQILKNVHILFIAMEGVIITSSSLPSHRWHKGLMLSTAVLASMQSLGHRHGRRHSVKVVSSTKGHAVTVLAATWRTYGPRAPRWWRTQNRPVSVRIIKRHLQQLAGDLLERHRWVPQRWTTQSWSGRVCMNWMHAWYEHRVPKSLHEVGPAS
jgi:hypothetical protein